jgi:hypothetical protein
MKDYPIVKICWEDAITSAEAGWTTVADAMEVATTPLPQMLTVGYVLHDNESWISVTDSVGNDEFGQVTKIPKQLIISIATLKELEI